ncbi:unnamed protein product [Gordionus sp. m RMFG-2023]|uniref:transmembrane emp24 domain-containing protein 10-like n=1 Tax=Gordionus sp. m RMFG-2023 TaxID=3053472 RepID=UPI0030E13165
MNILTLFIILPIFYSDLTAIWVDVLPNTKKCFQEEVHKDVPVVGEYEIDNLHGNHVSISVTNTKDHSFYQKDEGSKAKFSFTSDEYDVCDICFQVKSQQTNPQLFTPIYFEMKHGVDAKNFDDLGAAANLKPLEIEMKRLEDLSYELVRNLVEMKKREKDMRSNNESTSNRVFYFSVFGMLCLFSLAFWQVLYLRRYFKAKKLID